MICSAVGRPSSAIILCKSRSSYLEYGAGRRSCYSRRCCYWYCLNSLPPIFMGFYGIEILFVQRSKKQKPRDQMSDAVV